MSKAEENAIRDDSYSRQYRNRVKAATNNKKGKGGKKPEEKGVSENKFPDLLAALIALTGVDPRK